MAFVGVVAWLEMGGLRQTKRFERSARAGSHRLGDQADMVTALIQQRAPPGSQPMGALLKHRHLPGAWPDR
jgi:hypothetical protein